MICSIKYANKINYFNDILVQESTHKSPRLTSSHIWSFQANRVIGRLGLEDFTGDPLTQLYWARQSDLEQVAFVGFFNISKDRELPSLGSLFQCLTSFLLRYSYTLMWSPQVFQPKGPNLFSCFSDDWCSKSFSLPWTFPGVSQAWPCISCTGDPRSGQTAGLISAE